MPSLLVIMIALPAAAAAMLLLLDANAPPVRARWTALLATIATFLVSLGVASQFLAVNRATEGTTSPVHPHLEFKHTWLKLVLGSDATGGHKSAKESATTTDEAVAKLAENLNDPDGYVRLHAAEALVHNDRWASKALEALLSGLKDKDENIRWLATYSLAELAPESQKTVDALIEATQDPIPKVKIGAVYALSEIGPFSKSALGELQKLADSTTDPQLQSIIKYARHQIDADTPIVTGGESPSVSLVFHLGLDGISLTMVLLTTLLTISAVLVSWTAITQRSAEFYASVLILETGLIGVFCAFDLLLFYVFFEFTLIPLFFMVGIWGGPLRRYAAGKFFIYTLAGSVITLLGLIWLVSEAYQIGLKHHLPLASPFSIPEISSLLSMYPLSDETQIGLFLMIAAGFMVKVPLFPFHTWLPLAHVEAPTAGSVLLAGVLLKLGSYGFLRLCLPMLPVACKQVGLPLVGILSVIGIVYGSFCALAQNDIKKLVAYSSVAHLGFCMLGLFALNSEGISGGVLQMINHGLSTGALFCIVGMFYERYHTRQLSELGGLASRLPLLGVAMVFTSFASIGLPGLNGFVGEVLALMGMFKRDPLLAMIGASGVVLGAWYLLGVLQKAFFGPLQEPHHGHGHEAVADLNVREVLTLAPLLTMCLWLGLFPQPVLDLIRPDVESITRLYGEVRAQKGPSAKPAVAHAPAAGEPVTELASATPVLDSNPILQKLAAPAAPTAEVRP